jgi:hypothetical protein
MIVENKLTPLTREAAARALAGAYQTLTGKLPTPAVLALLLAQSALETGNWQKIHNFNFGNAKASPDYPIIVQFRCSEVNAQGVEEFFDPPHPQCNFRAYEDAESGALDYLKVLHNRPHWWRGLHTGSPSAFVDALATPPKYFTANPARYKRTVTALFEAFRPLALAALEGLVSPSPSPALLPPDSSGPRPVPPNESLNGATPPGGEAGDLPTPVTEKPWFQVLLQLLMVLARWLIAFLHRPPRGPGASP